MIQYRVKDYFIAAVKILIKVFWMMAPCDIVGGY
jgi:hypothetical protein